MDLRTHNWRTDHTNTGPTRGFFSGLDFFNERRENKWRGKKGEGEKEEEWDRERTKEKAIYSLLSSQRVWKYPFLILSNSELKLKVKKGRELSGADMLAVLEVRCQHLIPYVLYCQNISPSPEPVELQPTCFSNPLYHSPFSPSPPRSTDLVWGQVNDFRNCRARSQRSGLSSDFLLAFEKINSSSLLIRRFKKYTDLVPFWLCRGLIDYAALSSLWGDRESERTNLACKNKKKSKIE